MNEQLKNLVKEIFKLNAPSHTSARTKALCGLATGIPLFWGFYHQQLPVAIYGALFGYFITAKDSPAFAFTVLSSLMPLGGFHLGLLLQNPQSPQTLFIPLAITMAVAIYIVGMAKEERVMSFTVILLLIAAHSIQLDPKSVEQVSDYLSMLSYKPLFVVLGVGFLFGMVSSISVSDGGGGFSSSSSSSSEPTESKFTELP